MDKQRASCTHRTVHFVQLILEAGDIWIKISSGWTMEIFPLPVLRRYHDWKIVKFWSFNFYNFLEDCWIYKRQYIISIVQIGWSIEKIVYQLQVEIWFYSALIIFKIVNNFIKTREGRGAIKDLEEAFQNQGLTSSNNISEW